MYTMYFNDIHLSFFYPQSSLSIHLQMSCSFLFLFLITHWVQSKTCMYISAEPVTRIWGHTSKEIWRSLSQQPPRSTANSFSARGWGLWTTPVSWKCGLTRSCTELHRYLWHWAMWGPGLVTTPGLQFTALLPIFRLSHSFCSLSCAAS